MQTCNGNKISMIVTYTLNNLFMKYVIANLQIIDHKKRLKGCSILRLKMELVSLGGHHSIPPNTRQCINTLLFPVVGP